jgi:hypothetical protein
MFFEKGWNPGSTRRRAAGPAYEKAGFSGGIWHLSGPWGLSALQDQAGIV